MDTGTIRNFRRRRKIDLIYIHGNKCSICGYNKCICALEFHHINPEEKLFSVSNGNCRLLQDDINESKKCILVCSNCHKEIHSGLFDSVVLVSSFDENKSKEIIKLRSKKHKFCKICGKEIFNNNKYCRTCVSKARRKVERPNRTTLKKEIRETSFVKLGKKYGVSDKAITKWCISYDLPSKSSEIRKYTKEEWNKV